MPCATLFKNTVTTAQISSANLAAELEAKATAEAKATVPQESLITKTKSFVHDHPYVSAAIAAAVAAGIATAIAVPLGVPQRNYNRNNNQRKQLNNQAVVTRLIQLLRPSTGATGYSGGGGGGGGGYQPPI